MIEFINSIHTLPQAIVAVVVVLAITAAVIAYFWLWFR